MEKEKERKSIERNVSVSQFISSSFHFVFSSIVFPVVLISTYYFLSLLPSLFFTDFAAFFPLKCVKKCYNLQREMSQVI